MRWVCLFILWFPSQSFAESLGAVRNNNKGVSQLEEENTYTAQKYFLEGLTEDPFNPAIRMNLGLSYELEVDPENAAPEDFQRPLKEYLAAVRDQPTPSPGRFAALFNAARVLGNMGAIDQALDYYQKALEVDPGSKEVKTNIELLMMAKQGKGKGQGQSKNNNDDKQDGEGEGENDKQKKPNDPKDGKDQKPKKPRQKKEFKSKELSKNDVRKILEELKNQEQKIRAKEYNKGKKEHPRGKDW